MSAAAPRSATLTGLAQSIDLALPQTQCTRCGYPDCAGYAQAIADGQADINQCPPGGEEGIARLAALTGRPVQPLNPQFGIEGPLTVARIDEAWCIGCTLCIKACPTDAILGANKHMHTVIAQHCTGCELCIPVCPVDCIHLDVVDASVTGWQAWTPAQADHARARYAIHQQREAALAHSPRNAKAAQAFAEQAALKAQAGSTATVAAPSAPEATASPATAVACASAVDPKKAAIAAALAKARALRART